MQRAELLVRAEDAARVVFGGPRVLVVLEANRDREQREERGAVRHVPQRVERLLLGGRGLLDRVRFNVAARERPLAVRARGGRGRGFRPRGGNRERAGGRGRRLRRARTASSWPDLLHVSEKKAVLQASTSGKNKAGVVPS